MGLLKFLLNRNIKVEPIIGYVDNNEWIKIIKNVASNKLSIISDNTDTINNTDLSIFKILVKMLNNDPIFKDYDIRININKDISAKLNGKLADILETYLDYVIFISNINNTKDYFIIHLKSSSEETDDLIVTKIQKNLDINKYLNVDSNINNNSNITIKGESEPSANEKLALRLFDSFIVNGIFVKLSRTKYGKYELFVLDKNKNDSIVVKVNRTTNKSNIQKLKGYGVWDDIKDLFFVFYEFISRQHNIDKFVKCMTTKSKNNTQIIYVYIKNTSEDICDFTFRVEDDKNTDFKLRNYQYHLYKSALMIE